jgi:hypothetical protein
MQPAQQNAGPHRASLSALKRRRATASGSGVGGAPRAGSGSPRAFGGAMAGLLRARGVQACAIGTPC